MITFVESLLKERLILIGNGTDMQVERAHWTLGPQPSEGTLPCSVVVRFLSFKCSINSHYFARLGNIRDLTGMKNK